MSYREVQGNLITLAQEGEFDLIAHGCNCFCTMGAGLAPQMAKAFGCDKFPLEHVDYRGDINKLGQIDVGGFRYLGNDFFVVNCYSQYGFGANHEEGKVAPLDYEALILCLRKIGHIFKGKHIGLPQIGCHLAGGDWEVVKEIIKKELSKCDITIVIYKP